MSPWNTPNPFVMLYIQLTLPLVRTIFHILLQGPLIPPLSAHAPSIPKNPSRPNWTPQKTCWNPMYPYLGCVNFFKYNISYLNILFLNLRSVPSLVNILVQNTHRNKIKDNLICIERAVEKHIKLLLQLPRKPRNHQKQSINSFLRHPVGIQLRTVWQSAWKGQLKNV